MNIQELYDRDYEYYCASVEYGNTIYDLNLSTEYLNVAKEVLKNNYLINGQIIDDGNLNNIIERITNLKNHIQNNVIPKINNEKQNIQNQINSI